MVGTVAKLQCTPPHAGGRATWLGVKALCGQIFFFFFLFFFFPIKP